ncbi:GNAT family N-acetyltransferase [Winogradskya consettensis]|uniref:N-acetyltransferase n=1 Tax=Winogradskya consettensis TaxID=113560 RepID=A0A919SMN0_9ACTN|nr:GNAT family N-acetyltransferase [Actinoplanes consettensis]GIM73733.1 N-acetyltransferase [Actinoplanes consettensis]
MLPLSSKRLLLREWHDDDAPFVLDMCSRWEVQRYIGPEPRVLADLDEARAQIGRWRGRADGVRGVWAVESLEGGQLLGALLLVELDGTGDTEIGWFFHPDAWGNGYAGEAAQTVLRYAFEAGLEETFAVTHPGNEASQAVCRRLGMTGQGRTDRYYSMTCELFSLTRQPS